MTSLRRHILLSNDKEDSVDDGFLKISVMILSILFATFCLQTNVDALTNLQREQAASSFRCFHGYRNTENDLLSDTDNVGDKTIHPVSSNDVRYMSWPFNFIKSSKYLTGSLAGDCGFDPLGIVTSEAQLYVMREAEIKHARLAMLGSLGWPTSELFHIQLAEKLSLPNLLQDGKVPSVLNGGLNNQYVLGSLVIMLIVGGFLENAMVDLRKDIRGPEELKSFYDMFNEEGYDAPGNYQFDPLRLGKVLCGQDVEKRLLIQTMEIFNGRMSMLACVGYAAQEFFTGVPLISETPEFFHPLNF